MEMKKLTLLLLLMLPLLATAQQLDYRATLNVQSVAQAFSLAPDGRLWMATRRGEVFYADSVCGLWHEVKLPRKSDRMEDYTIDHVFTPDSNTIVLAGYIYAPNNRKCTGNYIISSDAGRTWEFRTLDTCSEWIDESWRTPDNRIWMGGLSGRLLYSDDHGQTFRVIHRTDTTGDRIGAICMDTEGRRGVLAVFGNKLYLTDDGFQSVSRIETPKAQGALVLDRKVWYGRIHAAYQWRQWLILNQEGLWFYTNRDSIRWQPLPHHIQPAYLTPDANHLLAKMGDSLMLMYSPTEGRLMSVCRGSVVWSDGHDAITTTNDAIDLLHNGTVTHHPFYTTDYPIAEPYHKVRFDGSLWGYDGSDIYMKKGHRWGRVVNTGFRIQRLLPADTCLLVESESEVYSITRRRTTPMPMRYEHPLDRFLKAKPVELIIVSSTSGCFHHHVDSANYRRVSSPDHHLASGGDRFQFISMHSSRDVEKKSQSVRFFDAAELESLLEDFDHQPDSPLRRSDLGVTADDLAALLADTAHYNNFDGTTPRVLRQVAEGFDTISDATVAAALTAPEQYWSTTSYTVRFSIVNAAGDTMTLSRRFCFDPPYLLPCHVTLPLRTLYASNLPLMRFLGQQMPPQMLSSHIFTPLTALRRIAQKLDTNR